MNNVFVIARMTFLEARRNRITWSIVFFCLVLVLASFLFQEVTIASFDRIVRDVGVGAINIFGVMLAVFLGVNVVSREIERRTVYSLLAKPLSRVQYLLGKLLGVWLTTVVCLGLMLLAFIFEAKVYRGPLELVIFQAFWLMLVEFLVLSSFAILASTFTSSAISAFMTLSLYVVGHLSDDIYFAARKSDSAIVQKAGAVIFYVLPNLEKLNLKGQVSKLIPVAGTDVLFATGYGLVFVAAFMALAIALFIRRDLK